MTNHIKGQCRTQATLFPEVLDDFVSEDNPVRIVDAFVNELDLQELGFERVQAKSKGRPGYHPAILLKLYIYPTFRIKFRNKSLGIMCQVHL